MMIILEHEHMTFDVEASRFAAAESGTDSFKLLYKAAFGLMTEQPANAAFLFLTACGGLRGISAVNHVPLKPNLPSQIMEYR